jgi:hypothetical protein
MAEFGDQPDPQRVRLYLSIFAPSSLDRVAEAVSVATADETRVYVERTGTAYRWSLTHPGGAYPMLRITARFLRVDYHAIVVGCRSIADCIYVLCGDPESDKSPDEWAVLHFDGPTAPSDVKERIEQALS